MKVRENGRDKRIQEITDFVDKAGTTDENILVEAFAMKIFRDKIARGASYVLESRAYRKSLADSREKAIASLSKYYHVNKIRSKVGFFYIISSKSFPNQYKLGYSKDCEHRLDSYQTYSPFRDFYLVKYLAVPDAKLAESIAIKLLGTRLVNEWFRSEDIDKDFKNIAKSIAIQTNTPNRFYAGIAQLEVAAAL